MKQSPHHQMDAGLCATPRIAVVTPYCNEKLSTIRRCHESVIYQTEECTHFLVADGFPLSEIDRWNCRHMSLGIRHDDNGNTPRGIGGACAMNEGYDVIMYLDADNWYDPSHASSVLYTQLNTNSDVVFSSRYIVFHDGTVSSLEDPEDVAKVHVDTSCMAIFPGAHRSLTHWFTMPKLLSPRCDRIVFALLTSEFQCSWTDHKSVYFETYYAGHFKLVGKNLPADAKGLRPMAREMADSVSRDYTRRSYMPVQIDG